MAVSSGGFAEAVGMKKQNPALKVMIAIGGWAEGGKKYSDMANTAESRTKFVRSAVAFVKEHGFDGLDYDWEYPGKVAGSDGVQPVFGGLVMALDLSPISPNLDNFAHF